LKREVIMALGALAASESTLAQTGSTVNIHGLLDVAVERVTCTSWVPASPSRDDG
jgi:hypothetical protein